MTSGAPLPQTARKHTHRLAWWPRGMCTGVEKRRWVSRAAREESSSAGGATVEAAAGRAPPSPPHRFAPAPDAASAVVSGLLGGRGESERSGGELRWAEKPTTRTRGWRTWRWEVASWEESRESVEVEDTFMRH